MFTYYQWKEEAIILRKLESSVVYFIQYEELWNSKIEAIFMLMWLLVRIIL